ncbi:MAG: IscA/HesB family protein [Syntrophobacteraceae bacterium]
MIYLSEKAEDVLKDHFKDKAITPIRIFLQTGGCAGQSLALVLDEAKATDDVYQINGFTMIIDKKLHERTKDITVDYVSNVVGSGFRMEADIPVGGCGCSCSCQDH